MSVSEQQQQMQALLERLLGLPATQAVPEHT